MSMLDMMTEFAFIIWVRPFSSWFHSTFQERVTAGKPNLKFSFTLSRQSKDHRQTECAGKKKLTKRFMFCALTLFQYFGYSSNFLTEIQRWGTAVQTSKAKQQLQDSPTDYFIGKKQSHWLLPLPQRTECLVPLSSSPAEYKRNSAPDGWEPLWYTPNWEAGSQWFISGCLIELFT